MILYFGLWHSLVDLSCHFHLSVINVSRSTDSAFLLGCCLGFFISSVSTIREVKSELLITSTKQINRSFLILIPDTWPVMSLFRCSVKPMSWMKLLCAWGSCKRTYVVRKLILKKFMAFMLRKLYSHSQKSCKRIGGNPSAYWWAVEDFTEGFYTRKYHSSIYSVSLNSNSNPK